VSTNWKRAIKFGWVVTNVGILLLGLGSFLPDASNDFAAFSLLPFVFVLSFPASVSLVLFLVVFADGADLYPPLGFALIWFAFFVAGCIQWMWLAPRLAGRTELITLGLASTPNGPIMTVRNQTLPLVEVEEKPVPGRLNGARVPRRPTKRDPTANFDRHGRTPLERVIYNKDR
jgi:hypothetical protein